MKKIAKAMELLQKTTKNKYGDKIRLENGDSIKGVFNDAIITISKGIFDEKAGTLYKFDFNLNLVGREGD